MIFLTLFVCLYEVANPVFIGQTEAWLTTQKSKDYIYKQIIVHITHTTGQVM
jgi:hypothetical protein